MSVQTRVDTGSVHGGVRFHLLRWAFQATFRGARLTVNFRNGTSGFAAGDASGRHNTVEFDTPATLVSILRNPDPGLGEAYMDGRWRLVEGDVGAFLTDLARNRQRLTEGPFAKLFGVLVAKRNLDIGHDVEQSQKNAQHHYDTGNDLFERFLDEGMNYSCAFFDRAGMSLREAQLNKISTTIARLDVRPGMKVLDIGCGWGEVSRTIAAETDAASVDGITLAENQFARAVEYAAPLGKRAPSYHLEDYRVHAARHPGTYDRIVSIGMFEHVGEENYGEYFKAVRDQLTPGGRAVIHTIVRPDHKAVRNLSSPWLGTYIFPGGWIPSLLDVLKGARAAGLEPLAEPYLHGPHNYAETLRHWRANFVARADELDPEKYDATFRHMWVFYLAMCEALFDGIGYQVAQVALGRAGK